MNVANLFEASAVCLWCLLLDSAAWVILTPTTTKTTSRKSLAFVPLSAGANDDETTRSSILPDDDDVDDYIDADAAISAAEEDECFDLCDIDWDLMMPDDDEEEEPAEETGSEQFAPSEQERRQLQEQEEHQRAATARLRLETQWQGVDEAAIPTQEEDECFDECDIDWDLMPDEEEPVPAEETSSEQFAPSEQERRQLQEQEHQRAAKARLRLEMQWQVLEHDEQCHHLDVFDYKKSTDPNCGGTSKCHDCGGQGWTVCRFCGGKKVLMWMQNDRRAVAQECPVCKHEGTEVCKTCRGTGWIAPWAAAVPIFNNSSI